MFKSEEKQETDEKLALVNVRDSIRLTRTIALLKDDTIVDDEVKFKAAFIFLHTGGSKMPNDSLYFYEAHFLFKNLRENSLSKKWRRKSKFYMEETYRRGHDN